MVRAICLFAAAMLTSGASFAQGTYPAKSVKVIVPQAAGGSSDLMARVFSEALTEALGQSFVVENKTGAGGTIGAASVATSPPDGYTLLMVDQSFVLAPNLYKTVPYDLLKDFTPISDMGQIPAALVVNPELGIKTLAEFIAYCKANPGKLNYGSGGVGSAVHLATEFFARSAGCQLTHVPFSGGGGPMMSAVVGNHVQMVLTAVPTVASFVQSGKLVALAVTTDDGKRSSTLPNVPSMGEAGLKNATLYFWYGLSGPANMPKEVVNAVHTGMKKAVANPKVKEKLEKSSAELSANGPDAFGKLLAQEQAKWQTVIRAAGIKPE